MARNTTDFKFELDVFWVQHSGVDPIELMNKYPDFCFTHASKRHGSRSKRQ